MKTKHVFNLTLLCSAIVLSGCGGDKGSSGTENQKLEPYLEASMARATTQTLILQGSGAKVPLSNNLLMDAKTGSLKIPTRGNDDISNPIAALNYANGFSTTMPIYIEFSGIGFSDSTRFAHTGDISVDAVKLVKIQRDGTPKLLGLGSDFIVATKGNMLSIIPMKPLDDSSNYLVVVTDKLEDKSSQPVGISVSYAHLKSSKTNYKGSALESAKSLIQDQEKLASHIGIDTTRIVYSASFKTASVGKVLTNTAKLLAENSNDLGSVWNGSSNPNNIPLSGEYGFTLDSSSSTFTDAFKNSFGEDTLNAYLSGLASASPSIANSTAAKTYLDTNIKVTSGTVKLPYFLETSIESFSSVPFEPSVAKGKAVLSHPKIKSLQDVPFVLFSPANPTGVVIYQHGITTKKETAAFLANSFVSANLAVIAIDHPLHGERGADSGAIAASQDHPEVYLNLGALPVARDNMRQSVLDIIGLRIALRDLDLQSSHQLKVLLGGAIDKVKFLGHSMGGIVGIPAVSVAQNLGLEFKSAVYSSAGGHIAELLFASEEFGPDIKHKLLVEMDPNYKSVAEECRTKLTPDKDCFNTFEADLSSQEKLEIESKLARFKVAAQTLVDVVDPYSFLGSSFYKDEAKNLPTLLVQVRGDKVVPNGGGGYMYGTHGLNTMFNASSPAHYQFSDRADAKSHHSTLLVPDPELTISSEIMASALATQEIQKLVINFIVNDG